MNRYLYHFWQIKSMMAQLGCTVQQEFKPEFSAIRKEFIVVNHKERQQLIKKYSDRLAFVLPKTRQEAKDKGLLHYKTESQCIKGHAAPRLTSSGRCVMCESNYNKNYYKNRGGKVIYGNCKEKNS